VSSRPDARQTSIIRPDEVFIPSGLHTISRSFCASLHPSGRFSSTSGRLSVLDSFQISFQVPRKGRSINRPDDVVSRSDARLLKSRIAFQISSSGRLTVVVRTCVHQRRKLPIRLQPSGRLPIMVRTRALQIWKLRVEELPSGRSSLMVRYARKPYKEITRPSGRCAILSGRSS
jgi:hypothetical protein